MPTENEIAWAAGLFEGEGWITITPKTRLIGLNNCDLEVLRRFQVIMGGRIYGPYQRPNRQPHYTWRPKRRVAMQEALRQLYPWLSSRRRARADQFLVLTTKLGRPPK